MNHTPVEVSCLGTCNVDFISHVPLFAKSEDEVNIEKLSICWGGSALNFVSRISSIGIKSGLMARVGNDYYGQLLRCEVDQFDFDTSRLLTNKGNTGMAFIAINQTGEKSAYTFIGANANSKVEKGDLELIKNSNLLHMTGMYWEVALESSKHSKHLSFNPGSVMCSLGMEKLEPIIERTHILFLNQKEVYMLTWMKGESGAHLLVDMGVPMVVVTNGAKGAWLFTEESTVFSPAKKVKVVDTTGAGDNFAAGFIASFINGEKPEYCLDFANHTASLCVEKIGGSVIPPTELRL